MKDHGIGDRGREKTVFLSSRTVTLILETLIRTPDTAMDSICGKMADVMRDNSAEIRGMAKGLSLLRMGLFTLENFIEGNEVVMESTPF
jgi:hypothetical protein